MHQLSRRRRVKKYHSVDERTCVLALVRITSLAECAFHLPVVKQFLKVRTFVSHHLLPNLTFSGFIRHHRQTSFQKCLNC